MSGSAEAEPGGLRGFLLAALFEIASALCRRLKTRLGLSEVP